MMKTLPICTILTAAWIGAVQTICAADPTPADKAGGTPADAAEAAITTTKLFNGKDLTGWEGDPRLWSVQDGCITGQTTKEKPTNGNTFLIWQGGIVDFELTCKVKFTTTPESNFGNSGIQFRSVVIDPAKWVVGGLQADLAVQPSIFGTLYDERGIGRCAQLGQKLVFKDAGNGAKGEAAGTIATKEEIMAIMKPLEWSELRLRAKGPLIQIWVNGRQTVAVTNESTKGPNGTTLALQLHAGQPMMIQFKDLVLKPLQ